MEKRVNYEIIILETNFHVSVLFSKVKMGKKRLKKQAVD